MRRLPDSRRVAAFRRGLLRWYAAEGRHFPWRSRSATNYQRIISEVLLQRTRAGTVASFFPRFIRSWPSWRQLALAKRRQLETALLPIGLQKRRAQSILALARAMSLRRGRFPDSRPHIEALPGVGQYIANAVELFVHGRPMPLLDVNMSRLLERYFGPRQLADIRFDPYLQRLAALIVRGDEASKLNWGVLDFAASVCTIQTPSCYKCPLRSGCFCIRDGHGDAK